GWLRAAATTVALASAAPSASPASSRSDRLMMSPQCGGGRWVRRATHDKNDPAPSRVYRQSRRRPGVLRRPGRAPDSPEQLGIGEPTGDQVRATLCLTRASPAAAGRLLRPGRGLDRRLTGP